MKIIAFFIVLSLLSSLVSGQSSYLLGTWSVEKDDWAPTGTSGIVCEPVGTVQFIPNDMNSSSIYLTSPQWVGPGCSAWNLQNDSTSKIEVPFPASTLQSQLPAASCLYNSELLEVCFESYNSTSLGYDIYSSNGGAIMGGMLSKTSNTYNDSSSDSEDSDDGICNITINSVNFNLCAFEAADNTMVFNVTDILGGVLSFSLGNNGVNSCYNGDNDTATVWSTYDDNTGECYDVAIQSPTYAFLDGEDSDDGITITFPPTTPSNASTRGFQLIVNLECDMNIANLHHVGFTMSLFANTSANFETMVVNGSSIYGCPTTMYQANTSNSTSDISDYSDIDEEICQPIIIDSDNTFNLCPFNQTSLFNVSDILGGSLSFGLAASPAAECMAGDSTWAVYHDNLGNCYEVAYQKPSFSLFNEADPDQGLQITFPISVSQAWDVRSFQLVVNLLCNMDEVEPNETSFTMNLFATDLDDIETITVTGSTIYGCPMGPDGDDESIDV